MDLRRRGALIARELGSVLPRSARALAGENWSPTSGSGLRRLGEVALDELVLTGMTLTAPPPTVHSDLGAYPHIAAELGALGTAGCYRDPEPLRSTGTRLRNAGRLTFEQIRYVHDPRLPEALAAFGAPGVKIEQYNEAAAGQTVFHLHYHVLPCWENLPLGPAGRMGDMERIKADAALLAAELAKDG